MLGSASSGSFTSETSILQRNMSSLSLPSDDMAQSVLHQVPAGSWPPVAHDHLGALLAAGKAPLAGSLHGMVLPDAATLHAAVQAATLQHRLAMLQVRSWLAGLPAGGCAPTHCAAGALGQLFLTLPCRRAPHCADNTLAGWPPYLSMQAHAVDAASLLPTPAGAPGLASVHQLYGGTLQPGLSSFGLSL